MVTQFLIALASALAALVLALGAIRVMERRRPGGATERDRLDRRIEPIVFLFRAQRLIDATGPAQALLAALPGEGDWQKLVGWLGMRLPEFSVGLFDMGEGARVDVTGGDGAGPGRGGAHPTRSREWLVRQRRAVNASVTSSRTIPIAAA